MTTSFRRFVQLSSGLALLLATRPAAAACPVVDDYDSKGHRFLQVVGTAGKQTAIVTLGASTTVLSLDCNGDGDFTDAGLGDLNAAAEGSVDGLELQLGGADTITVNLSGDFSQVAKALRFTLGPGTNVVNVGSSGPLTFSDEVRLQVDILGGAGVDKPSLDFSNIILNDSAIIVRADLGGGNDVASLSAPLQNSGTAAFSVDLALGLGANSFVYNDGLS